MGSIVEHFVQVIGVLYRALGTHVRQHPQDDSVLGIAFARAERIRRRFVALFALWSQGRLKPVRQRAPRPVPPTPATVEAESGPATPAPPGPKPPRRRGWVTHTAPPCAEAGGWLQFFLQRDDMPAFLAAVPRAGRLLRPLCHMLGVAPPEYLQRPPRPPRPRARRPRPERREGKYPRFNPYRYSPGKMPTLKKTGA